MTTEQPVDTTEGQKVNVDPMVMPLPCICAGNWRNIIHESVPLFDKKFKHIATGLTYVFIGVMHGEDDFYYCMSRGNDIHFLSCVGSIEQHGYVEA